MADRLSQLQDAVNVQADNLCNGLGVLQQMARPTNFLEFPTFNRNGSTAYERTLLEAGIQPNSNTITTTTTTTNNNNDNSNENQINNGDSNNTLNNNKKDGTADGVTTTTMTTKTTEDRTGATELIEQSLNPDLQLQQQQQPQFDNAKLFAKLITKTAKDIDVIIDSLPTQEIESDIQEAHIRRLEMENEEQARELEAAIEQGESMLNVIKTALDDIAQHLMMMKQLESRMLSTNSTTTSTIDDNSKLLNSER